MKTQGKAAKDLHPHPAVLADKGDVRPQQRRELAEDVHHLLTAHRYWHRKGSESTQGKAVEVDGKCSLTTDERTGPPAACEAVGPDQLDEITASAGGGGGVCV